MPPKLLRHKDGLSRWLEMMSHGWRAAIFIVVLMIVTRLHGITSEPTDWHAFRQADTASVTYEYVRHGVDLLRPTYQDLSNIASGLENPNGYRMVEFPIVNAGIALVLRALPFLELATVSRLSSALFMAGGAVAFWWLIQRHWSRLAAWWSVFFLAFLPYVQYYSRAILPEPPLVASLMIGFACYQLWLDSPRRWWWWVSALVWLALALLLKPFALFFIPVAIAQWWISCSRKSWKIQLLGSIVFLVMVVIPLVLWRWWILQFPSGIPASTWLLNGDGIRLRPAWFRWLFWDRLTQIFLGYSGVVVLIAGVWQATMRRSLWLASWGVSTLAYLVIVATGNVRHDYYQFLCVPFVVILLAVGMAWAGEMLMARWDLIAQRSHKLFINGRHGWEAILSIVVLVSGVLGSFLARQFVEPWYATRPDWEQTGLAVRRLLPDDARVIAPAFGDTAFLFQTRRRGWPIGFEIEKKRELGAQYYVSTAYDDEARMLERQYPTIEKNALFLLLDLRQKGGSRTLVKPKGENVP